MTINSKNSPLRNRNASRGASIEGKENSFDAGTH
jgi:chromosome segregation ATPase